MAQTYGLDDLPFLAPRFKAAVILANLHTPKAKQAITALERRAKAGQSWAVETLFYVRQGSAKIIRKAANARMEDLIEVGFLPGLTEGLIKAIPGVTEGLIKSATNLLTNATSPKPAVKKAATTKVATIVKKAAAGDPKAVEAKRVLQTANAVAKIEKAAAPPPPAAPERPVIVNVFTEKKDSGWSLFRRTPNT